MYKVKTDSATIGIFTLESIKTNIYGENYNKWVDISNNQPYVEYVVAANKYKNRGVIIDTGSDGTYKVEIKGNKIVLPVASNTTDKAVNKNVVTLKSSKYLLICSTEDMFEHRDNYDKIISMMKNKKTHRFQKGRGIIVKVSNSPKKVKLITNKKTVSITIT